MKKTKERVTKIIETLKKDYPKGVTALTHENPLELLIATILSAQCTDERVNKVTPVLFSKYKTAEDFAQCHIEDLKEIIRSTGFYNQKARFIKETSEKLVKAHKGIVPDNMEELLELPGVARKTANVVLGSAFGKTEGIVVDTHVKRLSFRLGLTSSKNPDKIEKDLMKIIPKEEWIYISHGFIWHGRKTCKARKPLCSECSILDFCPEGRKSLNP